jgi:LacI family transcriptional regulator, gluconate utilization system Gnt-I transcriptional repressor
MTKPARPLPETLTRQRRGHGRVTLEEVARQAGVTSITVSRFLREPQRVAPPTAERIQAALQATGYLPNKQAGQLASGRSRIVAAIIPSIANSIFAETVQGLSDGLQPAGYELLLASTGYSMEREEEQIRALLGWFPSGLIVTGRHHTPAALAMLHAAVAAGTPVIEVWDLQPVATSAGFTQVGFNHERVGRAMAEHLLALGHTALAYVDSGVAEDFRAHERGAGFQAAARAAGASVRLVTAPKGEAIASGRLALAALMDGPRAIVSAAAFANDHLACGALFEAGARRLAVPGELALMGFGDFPISRQLSPALTTVSPPRYRIGHEAAALLLASFNDGEVVAQRELPWELQVRDSTVRG